MEPQPRCADCLLSVEGWEGVRLGVGWMVGHENYSRAQEVFCSAKGDLVPTSSSQHLVFSMFVIAVSGETQMGF